MHPSDFTAWTNDAEFLVESSRLRKFLQTTENMSAIVRMNHFPIRCWGVVQALAGNAADFLECRANIDDPVRRSIEHPENLLDVVRHLAEYFFIIRTGIHSRQSLRNLLDSTPEFSSGDSRRAVLLLRTLLKAELFISNLGPAWAFLETRHLTAQEKYQSASQLPLLLQ